MKNEKATVTSKSITANDPDNTIFTTIIRPRNILIVIGVMAIFILSFYLFL